MEKSEAVTMLRRLADAIEAMPNVGWDRKIEALYPALLGVLSLFKRVAI
jgi:hypothetical protein